ncbi:hypothetical protein [Sandaracinus amylolyticus]|uniref:hypothetical protein n=1 Tax=Sandaracinus amylolyticus TaxID=927083 RepID=UPI001F3AC85A|nr:hypothetical protein [Sandaracinus amylolyticus]UJR83826.1 Hypothetical protein I5071_58970 [Sandaracinus amylolyticus]
MTNDQTTLVVTRDRDAHAVVRGFAYQIDVTLERWLDLDDGEELHLEAGEDIDHIAADVASGAPLGPRTLEQIKDLAKNVTLKSAGAVEAVAAFIEHRANNPTAELRFRFTTTAAIGTEKKTPLPEPGISAWERIRSGVLAGDELAMRLSGIRELLKSTSKPSELAQETWDRFVAFVSDGESDLLELIKRFEWATSAPDGAGREESVRGRLRATRGDDDAYPYLFLHICRLLSTEGPKKLIRSDIERVASARTRQDSVLVQQYLTPLLDGVRATIEATVRSEVVPQLERIESTARGIDSNVREALARIGGLDRGLTLAIETSGRLEIVDSSPPLPSGAARRAGLVGDLNEALGSARWLALTGEAGIGKSSLVSLLCAARASSFPAVWLRLRDASPNEAAALMYRVVSVATSATGLRPRTVVLEDLPRATSGDVLTSAIESLAARLSSARVISTSAYALPHGPRALLRESLVERSVPFMTESEVGEVLENRGATPGFCKAAAPVVARRTGGHPTLVSAATDVLARAGWNLAELLRTLTDDSYADTLATEIFERLLRTVEDDPSCRELLSRAALAIGSLRRKDLHRLAAVEPALKVRDDCVHRALGTWIRDEGDGSISISPLLKHRASSRLPIEVVQSTHGSLARTILERGSVTPIEVARAVAHYARADEWGAVAFSLVHALTSIRGAPSEWVEFMLDLSEPYIPRLSEDQAVLVSAQRIRLMEAGGTDADRGRVTRALGSANTPGYVLAYLAATLGLDVSRRDFEFALALCRAAIRVAGGEVPLVPDALPSDEDVEFPDIVSIAAFLPWSTGALVSRPNDLREWTQVVAEMPRPILDAFLSQRHAQVLAPFVANRVWMRGPPPASDARSAADALSELRNVGERLGSELLQAAAARAHTVVLAEYLGRRDEAISDATQFGSTLHDPWCRFLVLEAAAAQSLYGGRLDDAKARYDALLSLAAGVDDIEVIDATIRAAQCSDDAAAPQLTATASAMAKRTYPKNPHVLARCELEHAVALLRAGRRDGALASTLDAQERLYDALSSDDSRALRAQLALSGHLLAYLQTTGRDRPLDSGLEPLKQGTFLYARDSLADRMDEEALVRTRGLMALAAASIGDRRRAVRLGEPVWSQLVEAPSPISALLLPILADPLAAAALVERRYERALSTLSRGIAAALAQPSPPSLNPEEAVVGFGLAASVVALMWDEAEGTTGRSDFIAEIGRARDSLEVPSSPDSAARWSTCATVLDLARRRPGWRAIYDEPTHPDLGSARYLLASTEDDADPDVSATLQVLGLYALAPALRTFSASVAMVIVPGIVAYWRARITREGMRFRAPSHALRVLNRIATYDLRSLRSLLEEIVFAAGARNIPSEALTWIRTG